MHLRLLPERARRMLRKRRNDQFLRFIRPSLSTTKCTANSIYFLLRFMRGRPDKRPDRHSQGNTRQRPGLTEDEVQELYEAFNLFDSEGTGKVDPREIKAAMKELGFESRNPIIYNMVSELEAIGREVDF